MFTQDLDDARRVFALRETAYRRHQEKCALAPQCNHADARLYLLAFERLRELEQRAISGLKFGVAQ